MVKVWISIQNIVFVFVLLLWVKEIGSLVSYSSVGYSEIQRCHDKYLGRLILSGFTCYQQCVSTCDSPNEYAE